MKTLEEQGGIKKEILETKNKKKLIQEKLLYTPNDFFDDNKKGKWDRHWTKRRNHVDIEISAINTKMKTKFWIEK